LAAWYGLAAVLRGIVGVDLLADAPVAQAAAAGMGQLALYFSGSLGISGVGSALSIIAFITNVVHPVNQRVQYLDQTSAGWKAFIASAVAALAVIEVAMHMA
jgi:heme exporter protein D